MRPAARMPKLTRRSRILIAIALGIVVLFLIGRPVIDTYVDWLWFGELGYRSVFTTVLFTRLIVFLVAAVFVGVVRVRRHGAGLPDAAGVRPHRGPERSRSPVTARR